MTDTTVEPIVIVEPSDYVRDIENLIRIKLTQLAEERSLMEYQRESLASINRIVNRTKGELARLQKDVAEVIMTTPDTNTVFLVAEAAPEEVKAPEIPERCETGVAIFKAWVSDYNIAVKEPNDRWQTVLFRGYNEIIKHYISALSAWNGSRAGGG